MLNLLIVDDEIHFVEAIKKLVDWTQFGISDVYIAHHTSAAEQIFRTHDIDVLLCDIEMPQESGLELLSRMRRDELRTIPILMTCHADFQYAKEAVRLGCSNYLLKPLSKEKLEEAIGKATESALRERELENALQHRRWWSRHQGVHYERFWTDLLNETIPPHREAVIREAEARQIPHSPEAAVLPILLSVRSWHQEFSMRDRKLLEYALKNAGMELIGNIRPTSIIVPVGTESWLLIMPASQQDGLSSGVEQVCGKFTEYCNIHLYSEVACYVGEAVLSHEISALLPTLLELDKHNVNGSSYVDLVKVKGKFKSPPPVPDMGGWATMLRQGTKDLLLKEAVSFIRGLRHQQGIDGRYLLAFKEDFLQMVHSVLQHKGVQAHLMFCDRESLRLSDAAIRSLADLERWLEHVITQATDYTEVSSIRNVVDRATSYILSNLEQNLSRESVASHVYLHPDYLTRLFKKELGCTIPEYMLRERIKLARQLLVHSELPVSTVATAIGYSNFSHFAKLFKQQTSMTPIDFRQFNREGNASKVEFASDSSRS
ncbi:response regulator [Cohnella abietis]|uniref:DNA-binding response regulator n=1 Tax=Cohnella abietis TaxID=2507935 RepID=A0A3T1D9M7_9BACL|nr:response regulator [Cohnella abietis]BBI34802.1 hypothetical protein KCTCHS21_42010 [Cohnella abietis]